MNKKNEPPREVFDDALAKVLIGKSLLIGITNTDSEGKLISRSQIFGIVIIADRAKGICIRKGPTGEEKWFPPDTRGIKPAPLGEYRNRATGEVVNNPDYVGSWTWTFPATTERKSRKPN